MLACALIIGCILVLASCEKSNDNGNEVDSCEKSNDKENEGIAPHKDPEIAARYLRDSGYYVSVKYAEEFETMYGYQLDSLECAVSGFIDEGGFVCRSILILYFEDDEALKAEANDIDMIFDEEFVVEMQKGKYGKIAWYGTENAIKIAADRKSVV